MENHDATCYRLILGIPRGFVGMEQANSPAIHSLAHALHCQKTPASLVKLSLRLNPLTDGAVMQDLVPALLAAHTSTIQESGFGKRLSHGQCEEGVVVVLVD